MSGDAARTRLTKSATAAAPCTVRGRVVRVAEEDQPGALRGLDELVDVDAQVLVEIHRAHLVPIFFAVSRGLSNVGQAVPSGLVGERERAHRVGQDLAGARAERDLIVGDAELAGERLDQHRLLLLRVERIAARFGELADDDVDDVLPGAEGVLVAGNANRGHVLSGGGVRHQPSATAASRPRAATTPRTGDGAEPNRWNSRRRDSDMSLLLGSGKRPGDHPRSLGTSRDCRQCGILPPDPLSRRHLFSY